MSKYNHT